MRSRTLVVALTTLILPLAGVIVGALDQPTPSTSVASFEPAVAVETIAPVEQAPPIADVALELTPQPTPIPPPPTRQSVNPFPRWKGEQSLNLLVVGVDRREPEELYRTDTLILAHVKLRDQSATLISIPRDLVVTIPNYGQDRINTAYAIGETQKPGTGLALLRNTVERNFDLSIHHHALVDFNCFRGAVDALGGVTVDVPQRIVDPYYPTDDYGYKLIVFEAGLQRMDGERALAYARSRYGDTDFGRMRRQQQLLAALREQALKVSNLGALPQAVRACGGMASDLSVLELVALGSAVREIGPSSVRLRVIDEQLAVPYTAPSGASVLLPRWDAIRAMIRTTLSGATASAQVAN